MSIGRPGLRRRQNGATAVEAQDDLLSHPMVRVQGRILRRAFTSKRLNVELAG